MIKYFQFHFNHEHIKPIYRSANPVCYVQYSIKNHKAIVTSISIPVNYLDIFIQEMSDEIEQSIRDAAQNNYDNLYNPKGKEFYATVDEGYENLKQSINW